MGIIERLKTRKTYILREPLIARLQRKMHSSSGQVTRLAVDTVLESKREEKKREWLAKGYSPALVEKALLLADEWIASLAETFAPGMPDVQRAIIKAKYDKALEVGERWIKAMMA